jgi:hypothetical protein
LLSKLTEVNKGIYTIFKKLLKKIGVRKYLFLLIAAILLFACHRKTCPAFMNGKVTGAEGSKEKTRKLFPKDMQQY